MVLIFRWLNPPCVRPKFMRESLEKLRRLARKKDYMFSFDLQDGHTMIGTTQPSRSVGRGYESFAGIAGQDGAAEAAVGEQETPAAGEPALVEHLGLEVDTKNGQLKVNHSAERTDPGRREASAKHSEPGAPGGSARVPEPSSPGKRGETWSGSYSAGTGWNGRDIWRSPTTTRLHTDSSLFAWGGV
ncbi:hypothetical protein CYMTET_52591 [Cymbomonas tetramitiformis]|uniref:Uncharacterized protein n=1 Tax=Cymbomonas tetramitiformis TaxID=36881 RepID=A0AAE0BKK3_9CHLO|nr:hypothetical protein CYMTET_52591 [Cymbomonas tetramitiformis]